MLSRQYVLKQEHLDTSEEWTAEEEESKEFEGKPLAATRATQALRDRRVVSTPGVRNMQLSLFLEATDGVDFDHVRPVVRVIKLPNCNLPTLKEGDPVSKSCRDF